MARNGNGNGKLSRNEAEKQMQEMLGFKPEFLSHLPEHGFGAMWSVMRDTDLDMNTALDPKTKDLIALSVAAHMKCKYCIYFHKRGAEAFGATQEEIREAIATGGIAAMFSNVLHGNRVDFEKFRKETDRAIEHMMSQSR